jgi:hypothetical protein
MCDPKLPVNVHINGFIRVGLGNLGYTNAYRRHALLVGCRPRRRASRFLRGFLQIRTYRYA